MKKRKRQSKVRKTPSESNGRLSKSEKVKPDPKGIQKLRKNVERHQKPLVMRSPS